MIFNYYVATVPRYLDTNVMDCPFAYCLRKYDLEYSHLLPRPCREGNCEYVVCMPSHLSDQWTSILKEGESMTFEYMRADCYELTDYTNTFVIETRNRVTSRYILVKAT